MNQKNYNKYLERVKIASDMIDRVKANEIFEKTQQELIERYGLDDDDVKFLIKHISKEKAKQL